MMAEIKGRGGEDGWWNTALNIEFSHTNHDAYTGGAIDVYKCVDQIVPELLHEMARREGMPTQVLRAYTPYPSDPQYLALGLLKLPSANTLGSSGASC